MNKISFFKTHARNGIIKLFHTTKFSLILLLFCVGCIIAILTVGVPDIAGVLLRILQISFAAFCFSTGYRKDTVCFYTVVLLASMILTVFSIYSIATYVTEIRASFGYVVIGLNITVLLAAQITRQVGLVFRWRLLKDCSITIKTRIVIIATCATLLPIAFAFTVIAALGESFQLVPHP